MSLLVKKKITQKSKIPTKPVIGNPSPADPTVSELLGLLNGPNPLLAIDPILYEIKPLLEQLVLKQNFWTKGKDIRNDGPRIWDLLQRLAKKLNQPIPEHVQQKVKALREGK